MNKWGIGHGMDGVTKTLIILTIFLSAMMTLLFRPGTVEKAVAAEKGPSLTVKERFTVFEQDDGAVVFDERYRCEYLIIKNVGIIAKK